MLFCSLEGRSTHKPICVNKTDTFIKFARIAPARILDLILHKRCKNVNRLDSRASTCSSRGNVCKIAS